MSDSVDKEETLDVLYNRIMPSRLIRLLAHLDYRLEKVLTKHNEENLKNLDELYFEHQMETKKEKK